MKRLIAGIFLASTLALGLPALTGHAAPSRQAQLVRATNGFGYWVTYYARLATAPAGKRLPPSYVNAQVSSYVSSGYPHPHGAVAGQLSGDLHLMNIPNGYRFHIESFTGTRAVETVHWLFGSNPHTPIDRLYWTYTTSGWKISAIRYVRTS